MGKRKHTQDGGELAASESRTMITRSATINKRRTDLSRRVFGVGELLENIIIFLPTADVIGCMRVCRLFQDTIEASPSITADLPLHGFGDAPLSGINPLFEKPTSPETQINRPKPGLLFGRMVEIRKRFWRIKSLEWEAEAGQDPGLFASIMLAETKPEGQPDVIKSRYLLNTIEICHPLHCLYVYATTSRGFGGMKGNSVLYGFGGRSLKTVGEAIKRLEDRLDEECLSTA